MDSGQHQQNSTQVARAAVGQLSSSGHRNGAGYMMAADSWMSPYASSFPPEDTPGSTHLRQISQGAGVVVEQPSHMYTQSGAPSATSPISAMHHVDHSLSNVRYVGGSLAQAVSGAPSDVGLGASAATYGHGARRLPAWQAVPIFAVPVVPPSFPDYSHSTHIYPTHTEVNNPPPQLHSPQQYHLQPTYSPAAQASIFPADGRDDHFPSFPYLHSQNYAARLQAQAVPVDQQHPSHLTGSNAQRGAVPAYQRNVDTSRIAQNGQVLQAIASYSIHTIPGSDQRGQPSQTKQEHPSSLPTAHLSKSSSAHRIGSRLCKWRKQDGSLCGILLDDLTSAGVSRHMRDCHPEIFEDALDSLARVDTALPDFNLSTPSRCRAMSSAREVDVSQAAQGDFLLRRTLSKPARCQDTGHIPDHNLKSPSRARLFCAWEGCHDHRPLLPNSVGKHVSARHLGDANTLTCNYCPQTFTRSDAGMRHVRKRHPEKLQGEANDMTKLASPN